MSIFDQWLSMLSTFFPGKFSTGVNKLDCFRNGQRIAQFIEWNGVDNIDHERKIDIIEKIFN